MTQVFNVNSGQALPKPPVPAPQGAAPSTVPRLALPSLEKNVYRWVTKAIESSTLQSYRRSSSCTSVQQQASNSYPNREPTGTIHYSSRASPADIQFLPLGPADPFTPGAFPQLQYVLRGPETHKSPTTPDNPSAFEGGKLQSLGNVLKVFFGFMRAGEFTVKSSHNMDLESSLSLQDVAVDSHLNPSMTHSDLGRIMPGSCRLRSLPGGYNASILCDSPGPFFICKDGSPLTRDTALRCALSQAGVDVSQARASGWVLQPRPHSKDSVRP